MRSVWELLHLCCSKQMLFPPVTDSTTSIPCFHQKFSSLKWTSFQFLLQVQLEVPGSGFSGQNQKRNGRMAVLKASSCHVRSITCLTTSAEGHVCENSNCSKVHGIEVVVASKGCVKDHVFHFIK